VPDGIVVTFEPAQQGAGFTADPTGRSAFMTTQSEVADRVDTVRCPECHRWNHVRAATIGVPRCASCATPLPWLTAADDRDFDAVVIEAAIPVLVDLWAPWCGPCRVITPGVERAAEESAGKLKAVKIDVDEAPRVAQRYGAVSLPTVLVFDAGEEIARRVGAIPPDQLLHWLDGVLRERNVR
jgi:thioredoxin 2